MLFLWAAAVVATAPSNPVERRAAMEAYRELQGRRKEKIDRVLAAAKTGNKRGLKREGAIGVPYTVGRKGAWSKPAPVTSSFDERSLAKMASCSAEGFAGGGKDWISVHWECPSDDILPWSSTTTSFKFEDMAITEVVTAPGPPRVYEVKPVKNPALADK